MINFVLLNVRNDLKRISEKIMVKRNVKLQRSGNILSRKGIVISSLITMVLIIGAISDLEQIIFSSLFSKQSSRQDTDITLFSSAYALNSSNSNNNSSLSVLSNIGTEQTSEKMCRCVIFRLDDVQDHYVQPAQISVLNLFLLKNQSVSLGLIMNHFGDDKPVVDTVREGVQRGLFEPSIHGWNHTDFSKMSKFDQMQALKLADQKINHLFGNYSNVFITPYNKFNNDTLEVQRELNIRIISAGADQNKHPYIANGKNSENVNYISSLPYQLPQTTAFRSKDDESTAADKPWVKIPISQVLADVDANVSKYGYAVIMMHPQDFAIVSADGKLTKEVDPSQIKDLSILIDSVLDKHLKISTFSRVVGLEQRTYPLAGNYSYSTHTTIAAPAANNLTSVQDNNAATLSIFTQGKALAGAAINPITNTIYVTNSKSDLVSVINGTTNSVVAKLATGGSAPEGITINEVSGRIYVANTNSNSVSMIDSSKIKMTTTAATTTTVVPEFPGSLILGIAAAILSTMILITRRFSFNYSSFRWS